MRAGEYNGDLYCLFFLAKVVSKSENYVARLVYQLREGALKLQEALEHKEAEAKAEKALPVSLIHPCLDSCCVSNPKAKRNQTLAAMNEHARELFALLDHEGEGGFEKPSYVAAAKGDFGLFEV